MTDSYDNNRIDAALDAIRDQIMQLQALHDKLQEHTPALVEPQLKQSWLPQTIAILDYHLGGFGIDEVRLAVEEPIAAPAELTMYESPFEPRNFNRNKEWSERYQNKLKRVAQVLSDLGVQVRADPSKYVQDQPKAQVPSLRQIGTTPATVTSSSFWSIAWRKIHGWTGAIIIGAIGSLVAAAIWKFILGL